MNTRKFNKVTTTEDGTKVIQRWVQEVKKDGSDSTKPSRMYPGQLIIYANGGYRYFGNMGSRERVSAEHIKNEGRADLKKEFVAHRRHMSRAIAGQESFGYSSN